MNLYHKYTKKMKKKYHSTITIKNDETRKLQRVLNVPQLRTGRIISEVSPSLISEFKTGKKFNINKELFLDLKIKLNEFSILLNEFSKKKVEHSFSYLIELMDIINTPFLNWRKLHENINVENTLNYTYLMYSYYQERKPNEDIILKYPEFFEQLRFELKALSFKIKI